MDNSITPRDARSLIKSLEKLNQTLAGEDDKKSKNTTEHSSKEQTYKKWISDEKKGTWYKAKEKLFKTAIGKLFLTFHQAAVTNFKSFFNKASNYFSKLSHDMFGPLLDDLSPIIDSLKTSGSFIKSSFFSFYKIMKGTVTYIVESSKEIRDKSKALFELLRPKKKTEEQRETIKQTDQLVGINRLLGRIMMWTKISAKNTAQKDVSTRAWADWKVRQNNMKSAFLRIGMKKQAIIKKKQEDDKKSQKEDTGGSFLSKLLSIGTSIGGGLLSVMTSIIPLFFGSVIIRALWNTIKDSAIGKWLDTNIISPVSNWLNNDVFPIVKKFFWDEFLPLMVDVFIKFTKELAKRILGIKDQPEKTQRQQLEERIKSNEEIIRINIQYLTPEYKQQKMFGGWNPFVGNEEQIIDKINKAIENKVKAEEELKKLPLDKTQKKARGGKINGPSGVDRVPAMLTDGEVVIRKEVAQKYGYPFFETLNRTGNMVFAVDGIPNKDSKKEYNRKYNERATAVSNFFSGVGDFFSGKWLSEAAGNFWNRMTTTDPRIVKPKTTISSPITVPSVLNKTDGTMTSSQIESLLQKSFGNDWKTAASIIQAESKGYSDAFNPDNTDGSVDYGLFQINSMHLNDLKRARIINTLEDLYNPETNIKAAKFLYDRRKRSGGDGFEDWIKSRHNWKGASYEEGKIQFKTGYIRGGKNTFNKWSSGGSDGGFLGSMGSIVEDLFSGLFNIFKDVFTDVYDMFFDDKKNEATKNDLKASVTSNNGNEVKNSEESAAMHAVKQSMSNFTASDLLYNKPSTNTTIPNNITKVYNASSVPENLSLVVKQIKTSTEPLMTR